MESDWKKLIKMLEYLKGTSKLCLNLKADNPQVVKWYVDASFAVHPDYRSHTGAVMTLGKGSVISMSKKQKLNTRSSTEAELVGADDAVTMILWTCLFMEQQGYLLNKIYCSRITRVQSCWKTTVKEALEKGLEP